MLGTQQVLGDADRSAWGPEGAVNGGQQGRPLRRWQETRPGLKVEGVSQPTVGV